MEATGIGLGRQREGMQRGSGGVRQGHVLGDLYRVGVEARA